MVTRHGRQLPQFPKHVRERIEDAQRGMDFYTRMSDVPSIALGPPLPPKRKHTPSGKPLEQNIQKAILDLLRHHPKIAFIGRFNRGRFSMERNGKKAFYAFNTVPGFPDLHGMLRGGRAFYCEIKRPGEKLSPDQERFINHVAANGALAFMANCVEDVLKALSNV
jgi:hypothetical protein